MSTTTDGGYQSGLVSVGEDEVVVSVLVVDGYDDSLGGRQSGNQCGHGACEVSHRIARVHIDDQPAGSGLLTVACEEVHGNLQLDLRLPTTT